MGELRYIQKAIGRQRIDQLANNLLCCTWPFNINYCLEPEVQPFWISWVWVIEGAIVNMMTNT